MTRRYRNETPHIGAGTAAQTTDRGAAVLITVLVVALTAASTCACHGPVTSGGCNCSCAGCERGTGCTNDVVTEWLCGWC